METTRDPPARICRPQTTPPSFRRPPEIHPFNYSSLHQADFIPFCRIRIGSLLLGEAKDL